MSVADYILKRLFTVNLAVFGLFIVCTEVISLGLVGICAGVSLGSLRVGLLYHGSCALASYSVVWLLERPGVFGAVHFCPLTSTIFAGFPSVLLST